MIVRVERHKIVPRGRVIVIGRTAVGVYPRSRGGRPWRPRLRRSPGGWPVITAFGWEAIFIRRDEA